jgi:hypothetical protein
MRPGWRLWRMSWLIAWLFWWQFVAPLAWVLQTRLVRYDNYVRMQLFGRRSSYVPFPRGGRW